MSAHFDIDMDAITRLTKTGRLLEATTLLQRGLSGRKDAPRSSPQDHGPSRRGESGKTPLIEMTRPSTPGGIWTVAGRASGTEHPQSGLALPQNFLNRPFAHRRGLPEFEGLMASGASAHEPSPKGASFTAHSIHNDAGSMRYKIYVPSGYTGKPLSLVVMLHGCTQTPDDFAAGTRMNEIAEEIQCLVAYPEQTKAANGSKCWNWFRPGDQLRDLGEPSLIADITRQVMRDCAVDPNRIFVAGLSAGGATAAIMGQKYPDLFKAVCVHSGLACGAAKDVTSAFAAMRSGSRPLVESSTAIPTIVFHGSADRTVNPSNADQVAHQSTSGEGTSKVISRGRSRGGMDFTRTIEKNAGGDVLLEQWVLNGAGHAWSGGSKKGSYTDPRGPDASREMMRFFAEVTTAQAPS